MVVTGLDCKESLAMPPYHFVNFDQQKATKQRVSRKPILWSYLL